MPAPRVNWLQTLRQDGGAGFRKSVQVNLATIPTAAGNTDEYVIAPEKGYLDSVVFSAIEALAAHDTNFITFSITNLGQAGAGTNAMLAATAANTTKITGGTAIVANSKRNLTLSATLALTAVESGDRLRVRVTGAGTLANTLTFPKLLLRFA